VKSSDEVRSAVRLIKAAILQSQVRAIQMVNQEQLSLYFGIGRYVSEHSRKGYWGTGAIGTISKQLKSELPGLKGFSEENIKLMRRFYEAWKDIETNSVVGTTEITNFNNSEQTANWKSQIVTSNPSHNDGAKILMSQIATAKQTENKTITLLRSQFATTKDISKIRTLPYAFTREGIGMLSVTFSL
jgi:hypothetical protein